MNKNWIISAGFVLLLASCGEQEQNSYTVKGFIKNAPATTVYLEEVAPENGNPVIVDSASIAKNGAFNLKTLSRGESVYNLRLSGNRYPFLSFINDTKEITVKADFENTEDPYALQGSPASQSLKDYLYTLGNKVNDLSRIDYPKDTLYFKSAQRDSIRNVVSSQRADASNNIKLFAADFINRSNHATLTLYALSTYQSIASNPAFGLEPFSNDEVANFVATANKKFPNNKSIAAVSQQLKGEIRKAPDFTLPDVNGQPVSLSSFKGKYLLVDFWASWCPPCRAENPNVVAAYKRFKDKNFTILGVSLDKEKAPWVQAIQQDSLTWTHVSDLKFWDSKVVPLYGFNAIPYNVLVNPEGVIIAENITGEALQRKLSEVLR